MINENNMLIIANLKNFNGDVIETTYVDQYMLLKENMIPVDTFGYDLFIKKENSNEFVRRSCQIGKSLREIVNSDKKNLRLLSILAAFGTADCAYIVIDEQEHFIPIDEQTKLVNNYQTLVSSFRDEVQNVQSRCK